MTMNKLRLWNQHQTWEAAKTEWEKGAREACVKSPLKTLKKLPSMPGMTEETQKNLRWKSLKWMFLKEPNMRAEILKHPFKYLFSFLNSLGKKLYKRDDDFFLFGVKNVGHFQHLLHHEDTLLIVGFSFCHKPFECPSGRFTDQCIHDPENSVCRQCFIGKCSNALPTKRTLPFYIPSLNYISEKILDLKAKNPDKEILFLITGCELTLEIFGEFVNMTSVKGIGVRLDGRICNTMEAFELSENGVKPGLTLVMNHTEDRLLELIRYRREIEGSDASSGKACEASGDGRA